MIRRRLVHVMLALMLLVSQHMAISHAMAHWANARETASSIHQGADAGTAKAFSQDQTCDKCLAFAQIASAVGSPSGNALALAESSFDVAPRACIADVQRRVVAYRSRAPPVAA